MSAPPRTRDPEDKIRRIVVAAAELIPEIGLADLTHRVIAARAGVAVGTITKYFESIDEVRQRALEHLANQVETYLLGLAEELAAADDPVDFLVRAAEEELADSRAVLAECALTYAGLFEEHLADLSLRWYRGFTDALAPYFGGARAEMMAMWMDGVYLNTALTGAPPDPGRLRATMRALASMPEQATA